jgi:hypothetical protein
MANGWVIRRSPSAIQPSAISHQPSAISHQPFSHQPSAIYFRFNCAMNGSVTAGGSTLPAITTSRVATFAP